MLFSLKTATLTVFLSTVIALEPRVEHLYTSRRLTKRQSSNNFNITFYHINDVHAHLDEFSSSGTDCTSPSRGCYGGYARVKTVVDQSRPKVQNSLFLNAGDEFQGTLFYSYYKGEKIAATLNQMGFDAMTIGNHEFDGGDDLLGAFLQNLTFPVTSANIKSTHPVLNKTILPYVRFDKYNLAVIGVTTETTPSIANVGKGTTFSNSIQTVQDTVNLIKSTTNITRVAALTHIGYDEDQKLAQQTKGLYLIMGGHSHTPLGNMSIAQGPYPTIVKNMDGEEVFIVTAYRWGEYLGYIDVVYDSSGRIVEYHGAPIHLTNSTPQDAGLQTQIKAWRGPFEAFAAEVVGTSNVVLDQSTCQQKECTLGNFMTDAMLTYRRNHSTTASFALINAGGIRATIDQGNITRGEILTSFPFGNAIVEISFLGADLWKVFEGIVSGVSQFNGKKVTSFFQVSKGIQVDYNPRNANGSKLVAVTVDGKPLDRTKQYNVVTLDFLAGGGDNFWETRSQFAPLDLQDQVLTSYVQASSPVNIKLEQRIRIVNGTAGSNGTSGDSGNKSSAWTVKPSMSNAICTGALVMLYVFFASI